MTTYHELSIDSLSPTVRCPVTGGGDGFGRIASMTYANAGASSRSRMSTRPKPTPGEIIDGGGHAVALELDVSDRTALKSTIDESPC